jgi:hypothetical protein
MALFGEVTNEEIARIETLAKGFGVIIGLGDALTTWPEARA